MTIAAGQQIGGYEILEVVSQSARGTLCRATCRANDRDHVRKGETVWLTLYNRVREQGEACNRFDRLAGILLQCSNDHMVRYLDAFKWQPPDHPRDRMPCLVTEHLRATPLLEAVKKGKGAAIQPETLHALLVGISEGLGYAQQRNVLPRFFDSNQVVVCENGSVKVTGFGEPTVSNKQSLSLYGHPEFFQNAPPEFSQGGRQCDHAAYMYGLGCTLFHAITGAPAFSRLKDLRTKGDCFSGMLTSHRHRWRGDKAVKPSFKHAFFEKHPETRVLLEQCLHPDRVARLSAPAALAEAIQPVLKELGPPPTPPPPPAPEPVVEPEPSPNQVAEPEPALEPATVVVEKGPMPRIRSLNKVAFGGVALALVIVAGGIKLVSTLSSRDSAAMIPIEPETTVQALATKPRLDIPEPTVEVVLPEIVKKPEPEPVPEPVAVAKPPEPIVDEVVVPEEPAAPVRLIIQIYVKPPTDKGPPIVASHRTSDTTPWTVVGSELEVEPGRHDFQFSRPDYEPILRTVMVEEGKSAAFVAGPEPREWKPTRKLTFLLSIEAAFNRRDMDIVSRVFAKPRNPVFEWEGHGERYEALRKKWFSQLKQNTLPTRIGAIALKVHIPSVPEGTSDVKVSYRQVDQNRWHPHSPGTLVQPGSYELLFQRADYEPIYKTMKIISGKKSFEMNGPLVSDWKPSPRLENLFVLEGLLASGDLEGVTARLAKPTPDTFLFEGHTRRMGAVRNTWYRSLLAQQDE